MQISSTKSQGAYRRPAQSIKASIEAALTQNNSELSTFAPMDTHGPQAYAQRAQARQMTEDLVTFEAARQSLGREDASVGDVIGKLSSDIRDARAEVEKAEIRATNHTRRTSVALVGSAGLAAVGIIAGVTGHLSTALSIGVTGVGLTGMALSGVSYNDPSTKLASGALKEKVERLEAVQDNMQMWVSGLERQAQPATKGNSIP